MIIEKDFVFDSAHFLPHVSPEHKCRRLHGHTYKVTVAVSGELTEKEHWVLDFNDVKAAIKPIIDYLDHKLLNSLPGLNDPTAEVIAKYIYDRAKPDLPGLYSVRVDETPTSRAIYFGEEGK